MGLFARRRREVHGALRDETYGYAGRDVTRTNLKQTSPPLVLQAKRHDEGERDRLQGLVDGSHLAVSGIPGENDRMRAAERPAA